MKTIALCGRSANEHITVAEWEEICDVAPGLRCGRGCQGNPRTIHDPDCLHSVRDIEAGVTW